MNPEELGDMPPYIAKKMQLRQEIRDIVAAATPQREPEYLPAGYFTRDDVAEWEVAEHLAAYGRHTNRYRPEH